MVMKWDLYNIPPGCITPIILKNETFPEYPFFSGTGFFVNFKNYPHVFLVTARHCVMDNDNNAKGILDIPIKQYNNCNIPIIYSDCLTTGNPEGYEEDIVIY